MVKRYCLVGKLESRCNCDMKEHPLGAFVGLKEYDSLERERDGLREALLKVLRVIAAQDNEPDFSEYFDVDGIKSLLAKGAYHER